MNPSLQKQEIINSINSKLNEISKKVNDSKESDIFYEISILINVDDELDDVLLNWDQNQSIPNKLTELFKSVDRDFDLDEDEDDDY